MSTSDRYVLGATHARDAGYDLLLLAHVLAAAVGLGAVVLAGAYAWALLRSGPESEPVRRYYRPGVNWAGRVLFLIPVLGLALMALSEGDWSFADGWITIGLALWLVVAVAAEAALWPAERRLQEVVAAATAPAPVAQEAAHPAAEPGAPTVAQPAGRVGPAVMDEGGAGRPTAGAGEAAGTGLRSECLRVIGTSVVLSVVLVGTAVVMVAKP